MLSKILRFRQWITMNKVRSTIATFVSIIFFSALYFAIKGVEIPLVRLVIAIFGSAVLAATFVYITHKTPN